MDKAIAVIDGKQYNLLLQYNSREEVRLIADMLRRTQSENIVALLWLKNEQNG
jgi:hypothetical protein